jgi:hypothetical protein
LIYFCKLNTILLKKIIKNVFLLKELRSGGLKSLPGKTFFKMVIDSPESFFVKLHRNDMDNINL